MSPDPPSCGTYVLTGIQACDQYPVIACRRENAQAELKGSKSSSTDQKEMRDILARVAASDDKGEEIASALGMEEAAIQAMVTAAHDEDPEAGQDQSDDRSGGLPLSDITLQRLLALAEAGGNELDVLPEDLDPVDLEAFHRAVAAGQVTEKSSTSPRTSSLVERTN